MDTGTDYSDWTTARLLAQREHLEGILLVSAGQRDPERPQWRDELKAVNDEIAYRTTEGE